MLLQPHRPLAAVLSPLLLRAGISAVAAAFVTLSLQMPTTANGILGIDFEKGQAGEGYLDAVGARRVGYQRGYLLYRCSSLRACT